MAYILTKHTPAEYNYNIHNKELLVIIKCVAIWLIELKNLIKPFIILMDHINLKPFIIKKRLTKK